MKNLAEKISNAELAIMQVIWAADGPLNYAQIRQAMRGGAKQTIQTLITRLVSKGVLAQEKREVYYYNPLVSEQEYAAVSTRELMARVYKGSAKELVATLFKEYRFSAEEIAELKRFWDELEGGENRD